MEVSCPSQLEVDPFCVGSEQGLPCREQDQEMWFAESPRVLARAKELCLDCPVRLACLAGALERQEPWGVWGGEIFDNGVVVANKRGRGRPRKADQWAAARQPGR